MRRWWKGEARRTHNCRKICTNQKEKLENHTSCIQCIVIKLRVKASFLQPAPPRVPPCSPLSSLLARADQLLTAASLGCSPAGGAGAGGGAGGEELSLEDRLVRLHASESVRDTRATHLNLASNLLDR